MGRKTETRSWDYLYLDRLHVHVVAPEGRDKPLPSKAAGLTWDDIADCADRLRRWSNAHLDPGNDVEDIPFTYRIRAVRGRRKRLWEPAVD